MKILIDVNSGFERLSIVVDDKQGIFAANGKTVTFDVNKFVFKVCDITMKWPDSLQCEDNISDGTQVVMLIEDNNIRRKIKYVNELPEDFYKLEILLDEVSNNVETNLR